MEQAIDEKKLQLSIRIHNLNIRIIQGGAFIKLHRDSMKALKLPFFPAASGLQDFGYTLTWDPERPQDFLQQLEQIEKSEQKLIEEKQALEKELEDLNKILN